MIGEIVKPRDVSVVPLMDAKEPEEVCRRGVDEGILSSLESLKLAMGNTLREAQSQENRKNNQ